MKGRRAALTLLALSGLIACGSDSPAAPSSAAAAESKPTTTTSSTSTTSMTVDRRMPSDLELQVMAAYEESWNVYRRAMRYFDTSQLAEVFAEDALEMRIEEVEDLRAANTPARMRVVHRYRLQQANDSLFIVWDSYRNHSVLLDGTTLKPIEPDPDEIVEHAYFLELIAGRWMVTNVYDADDVRVTYD